jgi:glycosyltransferase involved in cell wall biosynthesis/SAM-dependent methyltransferase
MAEAGAASGISAGIRMQDDLEFTGERYVPGIGGNIFLEHMHRYRMALRYVEGRDVLDVASGEGFGTNLLASAARSAVGVDLSEDAVVHAKRKYVRENLNYIAGSCTAIPLGDDSVDVVVSFETIEHIGEHELMLSEIRRVLRPGGVLIISTPEKGAYTDATGLTNPFHVRELYRDEFSDLLKRHFRHVTTHGQRIGFGSLIVSEDAPARFVEDNASTSASAEGLIEPLYLIAVASDDPDAAFGLNGLFSQDIQSSEPVLRRVEFELAGRDEQLAKMREAAEEEARKLRSEIDLQAQATAALKARLRDAEAAAAPVNGIAGKRGVDRSANSAAGYAMLYDQAERWQRRLASLQESNPTSGSRRWKAVRRMLVSSVLYSAANLGFLSERRRAKFLRSAKKRDPLASAVARLEREARHELVDARRRLINGEWNSADLDLRVTAIVPNYNHARYLRQRLDSILSQTYSHLDILILDDASTDGSRDIIADYVSRYPGRIRAILNEQNSGNVFAQWRRGHSEATGDLLWICESDDFCEPDFLENLVGAFSDPSVMLAFGRIQYADEAGTLRPGLDQYRETAEPGIWDLPVKRPAHEWFTGAFGARNLIANVGGSVWRNAAIRQEDWDIARGFRVMGDWYLYSVVAAGGQIAYSPTATSYFRIHTSNTSAGSAQRERSYYEEYVRLNQALGMRWNIPAKTVDRFIASARETYTAARPSDFAFDDVVNRARLAPVSGQRRHVLMGILGFSYGGGELFPIHLANTLHRMGVLVSMFQLTTKMDHPDVRRMLDPGIPVYRADDLRRMGLASSLERAGVTIVHSHLASVEMVLLDEGRITLPYIATLHGSYESMGVKDESVRRWVSGMDRVVYTAERNLEPFRRAGIDVSSFVKFRNAMPIDPEPFPQTRADLGISDEAVVFTFVARSEVGKGWQESVQAFADLARRRPGQQMALVMVGAGPETEKARALAAGHPNIFFLGLQQKIHGLYRMSDVALAPTRFRGESFPLCLIQAMQSGTPVISTDVGEIKAMIEADGSPAGIILPNIDDNAAFTAKLVDVMEEMLDPLTRARFAKCAATLGKAYAMDALALRYLALYDEALSSASAHHSGRTSQRT